MSRTNEYISAMLSEYGMRFRAEILKYIAPVAFVSEGNKRATVRANGTCFFISHGDNTFGVTANHVVEQANTFPCTCLGNMIFDFDEREISKSQKRDLFTFQISKEEISALGKEPVPICQARGIERGNYLTPCGFPGSLRSKVDSFTTEFIATEYAGQVVAIQDDFATLNFAADEDLIIHKNDWKKRPGGHFSPGV